MVVYGWRRHDPLKLELDQSAHAHCHPIVALLLSHAPIIAPSWPNKGVRAVSVQSEVGGKKNSE